MNILLRIWNHQSSRLLTQYHHQSHTELSTHLIENFKHLTMNTLPHNTSRSFLSAVLTGSCLALINIGSLPAQTPKVDAATHSAHAAAGTHPAPAATTGDPVLNQQIAQLQAKISQLEASLAKNAQPRTATMTGAAMPGMAAASPAMSLGMSQMKPSSPPGGMPGMGAGAAPSQAMAGMGGGSAMSAAPTAGMAMGMDMMKMGGMMGMMDKMMGMMDKMMPMGGSAMPAAAPMAGGGGGGMGMMDMDMMKMGGGAMPAPTPAAPMSGGGGMGMMDMEKMEMAGMMGMSGMGGAAPGAMPQSALPGFPGASHLYHIGATGFFLDHPQHITLTIEQQAGLNKAKEQALLAKSTADRGVEQAEQELWTLTAADQPDAAKIEGKIAEISKLTAEERLAFIRAVGEASKLLTDEQRKILTGFMPPVSTAPAAAPMAPMKDM